MSKINSLSSTRTMLIGLGSGPALTTVVIPENRHNRSQPVSRSALYNPFSITQAATLLPSGFFQSQQNRQAHYQDLHLYNNIHPINK